MKKLIWLGALALLLWGGKKTGDYFSHDREVTSYRDRVAAVLTGLRKGADSTSGSVAICMWAQGTLEMELDPFNAAAARFEAWRKQVGLHEVTSFEIGEVVIEKPRGPLDDQGIALVHATVDGRPFIFRTAFREPISVVR